MNKVNWVVENYVKENGEEPVELFLDSLPAKDEAKVLRTIQLLEEFGTGIPKPHFDSFGDGLFELRTKISTNIHRILYFHYQDGKFILLHGFTKKTQKTPPKEILRARKYMEDYKNRNKKTEGDLKR